MRSTILILLLSSSISLFSQQSTTVNLLIDAAPITRANVVRKYKLSPSQNEVQMLFTGFFRMYKYVLSSQDMNVCTFTPSCSEYGMLCIRKHGVFRGALLTLDRMTRCNPLSPEQYARDPKTGLFIDHP